MSKDVMTKVLGELQAGFVGNAMQILREALAEQPAQQLVDCHVTGVCVQSGLRAEQPAQQEPAPGYCKHCKQYTIEEPLPAQQEPLTDAQKLELVTNWFAEDWAVEKALGLLHDYDLQLMEKNT